MDLMKGKRKVVQSLGPSILCEWVKEDVVDRTSITY